jgi:penicillin-binding protein 1A
VREIDGATGRLANANCTSALVTEFFVQGYEPTKSCTDYSGPSPFTLDSARASVRRDTANPFRLPPN